MEYIYNWKRDMLSGSYFVFYKNKQIGYIKHSFFKTTFAELNGIDYSFKTIGILKRDAHIFNASQKRKIGKMKYNMRFNKARVSLEDKTVFWKYEGINRLKWKIYDARGLKIKYQSYITKGKITANTDLDDLALISGLYLAHNLFLILIFLFILLIFSIKTFWF
jgi:hypothetical protein